MNMATTASTQPIDAAERRQLEQELKPFNCGVHQPQDPPLFTREPQSSMEALHWRATDLDRLLARVGASLKLEKGGNRRTLRLTNPGLSYGTTPTFWASIQYILPGEIASAHRHTPTALRFIMRGNGAFTTVEGERYAMNVGDLVLNPSWAWHDHEHLGDQPMVWLDVLDTSLVRSVHAIFFDPSDTEMRPVNAYPQRSRQQFGSGLMMPLRSSRNNPVNPLLVYPSGMAMSALHEASRLPSDPHSDTHLEYRNPLTGGPALTTLGTGLQRLRPGGQCLAQRHTGSLLNYVISGSGTTVVEGSQFHWQAGDFIAIPPWSWYEHTNASATEAATLFQVNDIPALQALGLYRHEFSR